MTRDQALAKIRKCLALGKSANEHEAAAAMRQAHALMREHGLDGDDVDLAAIREAGTLARSPAIAAWDATLAQTVADAFGCCVFFSTYSEISRSGLLAGRPLRRRRNVVFVGAGAAPNVATYAYDVLLRQCTRARAEHVRKQPRACKPATKSARGDAFATGRVMAVRKLVESLAGREGDQKLIER